MSLSVGDACKLQGLKEVKLIAGENGLGRIVKAVGILDYEIGGCMKEVFRKGDFLVTSLYPIREEPNGLLDVVKELVEIGVCGLAIKNIYFKELSQDVIYYCSHNDFPIFLYPKELYTENIIYDIIKALKNDEDNLYLSSKVHGLLNANLSEMMVRRVALEINSTFKENIFVAYMKCHEDPKYIISTINNGPSRDLYSTALLIEHGVLLIISKEDKYINITEVLSKVGMNSGEYVIGTSSGMKSLSKLDQAIKEAVYAGKVAEAYGCEALSFDHIGLNKVIVPMLESDWLKEYYNSMINPLLEYDKKHETDLVKTACIYVNNDGDINKTAKALFQHGNTIRYRIKKIKELLPIEENISGFYEQLSFMIRVYMVIEHTV
ncbi:PucR family transcriptional regulator [Crassaminicella profunda]|uniref:PucR family transcriptional regulator n=1 Tax=Crassaminicella profunda TaxID=1286698 RepID=UPI001CA79AAA|nr:PucR family transcriptional regulator [Crassaminicella profunda]QZY53699.1 PucR family transcriptional regulator ligand-binding domain-containing protein [Crassaminicella profunda]